MGQYKKPVELKILDAPIKSKIRNKPVLETGVPRKPSWIQGQAANIWRRTIPKLKKMNCLADVDELVLGGYCLCLARWIELEKTIEKKGSTFETPNGYVQKRPEVSIARDYLNKAAEFAGKLGLSPLDRQRISMRVGIPENSKGGGVIQ